MIKLKYGSSVISLPGTVVEKLNSASENDLRVLIALSAGIEEESDIASAVNITSEDVNRSVSFWRGAGVIEGEPEKKRRVTPSDDASKVYTGAEIKQMCEMDKSLESLMMRCREILGSPVFAYSESSSVIYMRHNLGLEPEYILLLCSHYANSEKATMRFIEKKAITLYDDNIRTITALESYLETENKRNDMETKVRKLFGLGERSLTSKESEALRNWALKWNVTEEMLVKAFEETVSKTQKPSIAYMNAVLKNWHDSGENGTAPQTAKKKEHKTKETSGKKAPGFDIDAFFDAAVARAEQGKKK